jgi:hypothetical protein
VHEALVAPPAPDELTGEDHALATFTALSGGRRSRRALWRPAVLSTVLATKLGAAAAAGAVTLSGTAAAAFTGNLPNGLQDFAHRTIKAPPAHAKGPDATGPAAYGLCQAFAKDKDKTKDDKDQGSKKDDEAKGAEKSAEAKASAKPTDKPGKGLGRGNGNGNGKADDTDRGKSKERSVAYRNLVRAAGGEDKVEAYCASIPKPSGQPDAEEGDEKADKDDTAKPTKTPAHETGKPTSDPDAQKSAATPSATASAEQTPEPTETPEPTPTPTG